MHFEGNYKNVKITVSVGDIIQQQIGAIINPANSRLIMCGRVTGAINVSEEER
jgi:O-acetyl-ADP-ribose deacetylase (regulator of RNase III)